MEYTLHAAPGSSSFAPHIVLEEIGKPYALALMSPGHPETKTDEFRRLNPKGRVPVLTSENFILTEAPAILIHLGIENQETGLLKPDAESLVRAIEWFNWLSSAVHAVAVRLIWRPDYFCDDIEAHSALIAKGEEHLRTAYTIIEGKLQDRDWAMGDAYSVVDPYLMMYYRWGNRMRIDMKSHYPAWTLHAQRLEMRGAVQRVLEQENISIWE
jgi:glutathione S-transferase